MIIISGRSYVDEEIRDEYVAQHQEMVARVREQPGCLDLVIAADPLEEDRYNIYEAWESEDHLAEWRKVANPPEPSSIRNESRCRNIRSANPGRRFSVQ
ncbi:putative quinol monooxygenase [Natronococcus wangiae]|uniref:putative quinol monooxygenase n=1 Tax=Natronococcus wangiae TaxID=3068275 RepID=UPI00387E3AD6